MQPQQPYQPPTPNGNYDFILNPAQPPKKRLFGGGSSLASRLLLVFGAIFVLVVILGIIIRLLTSSGGLDKPALLSVAQDQTELIRLSNVGVISSVSQTNKNFSITAQLAMASEQQALLTYLGSNGYKPNAKVLVLKQSAKTDEQLEIAKSSSTFDTAYTTVMEQYLLTYQRDLKLAYESAGPSGKKVLGANYDSSALLLTQLTGKVAQE